MTNLKLEIVYRALSLVLLLTGGAASVSAQDSLTFDLTDNRKVIWRNINKELTVRAIKDRSVTRQHFGWLVEVVRRPARKNSRNLIYANKTGGADQSQVMAWMIEDENFPKNRRIAVRGFPYVVRIDMIDPRAEGRESDAGFISGKLKISWTRTK